MGHGQLWGVVKHRILPLYIWTLAWQHLTLLNRWGTSSTTGTLQLQPDGHIIYMYCSLSRHGAQWKVPTHFCAYTFSHCECTQDNEGLVHSDSLWQSRTYLWQAIVTHASVVMDYCEHGVQRLHSTSTWYCYGKKIPSRFYYHRLGNFLLRLFLVRKIFATCLDGNSNLYSVFNF